MTERILNELEQWANSDNWWIRWSVTIMTNCTPELKQAIKDLDILLS
jgi:hypothetical protein